MVETSSYEERMEEMINSFKQMLVSYYESGDVEDLAN